MPKAIRKNRYRLPLGGFGLDDSNRTRITLYLSKIYSKGLSGHGIPSFSLWYQLLSTFLHEIGHFMQHKSGLLDESALRRYKEEEQSSFLSSSSFYYFIERGADRFRNAELNRLATLDDRLFQPAMLGYLGVRLRNWENWILSDAHYGSSRIKTIQDIRGRKIGGQYTLTQAIQECVPSYWSCRNNRKIHRQTRQQFKEWLKDYGMGTVVKDACERRHIFLTHGEVMQLKSFSCVLKLRQESEQGLKEEWKRNDHDMGEVPIPDPF